MPRSLSDEEVAAFRERLCVAASRLFAENGASGVTMRGLAVELNVSAMTPYRYFHDKNEILAVLRARAFDRFSEIMEATYDRNRTDTDTIEIQASRICDSYVRFATEHPDFYKLMFDLQQPGSKDYVALSKSVQRAKKCMVLHMRAMQPSNHETYDPDTLGLVFWSTLHGIVSLELTKQLEPDVDIATMAKEASEVLVQSIGHNERRI